LSPCCLVAMLSCRHVVLSPCCLVATLTMIPLEQRLRRDLLKMNRTTYDTEQFIYIHVQNYILKLRLDTPIHFVRTFIIWFTNPGTCWNISQKKSWLYSPGAVWCSSCWFFSCTYLQKEILQNLKLHLNLTIKNINIITYMQIYMIMI
jgi:hypothetical protein